MCVCALFGAFLRASRARLGAGASLVVCLLGEFAFWSCRLTQEVAVVCRRLHYLCVFAPGQARSADCPHVRSALALSWAYPRRCVMSLLVSGGHGGRPSYSGAGTGAVGRAPGDDSWLVDFGLITPWFGLAREPSLPDCAPLCLQICGLVGRASCVYEGRMCSASVFVS